MTLTPGKVVLSNPLTCTNTAKGDNKLYSDAKGVVPSLDLRFAEGKTLNDYMTGQNLITFSRPVGANQSPGTYVDENGIIQLSSADQPRFDHDPTTGESLGLLVEESRTNLLLRSEEFENFYWNKSQLTVVPNNVAAPDGTLSADLCSDTAVLSSHSINTTSPTLSTGTTYTFSVYAKAESLNYCFLLFYAGGGAFPVTVASYDLVNITASSEQGTPTFNIEDVGNGWRRLSITGTTTATATTGVEVRLSPDGVWANRVYSGSGQGIYIWGAQLEEGSFPTSYIPTTSTALTRSADVASISGSDFSSWYNQSEGTVFIDVLSFPSGWKSANRAFIYISDTTVGALSANDGIKFGSGTSSNTGRLYVTEAGTNSINFGLSTLNKIAIGLALGDGAVYADGSLVGTSASVAMPVGMDRLAFTTAGTGKEHIARLTYFPERLPDSTLQAITQ